MKIVTILLKYDYGIKGRGESLEKKVFLPAIQLNCDEVVPFWIEENGFYENRKELQKNIIDFVVKENPAIVFFILMYDEVTPDTIKKISENCITINWFADDQWRFADFTKYIAPLFHYSITMDKYSLIKYKDLGCKSILSQWAALDYVKNMNLDNVNYMYDISFIGGKNINREWIIYELKNAGYYVECFGDGWGRGRIDFEEMKNIFYSSKINLNLSNSTPNDIRLVGFARRKLIYDTLCNIKKISLKNPVRYLKNIIKPLIQFLNIKKSTKKVEQIKARNFEIPGFGGFQLSQYALEIEDYYVIGKEIAVFSTLEELKKQIDYYLQNEIERKSIVKAGYDRTKEYTYEKRFRKIFEEVNKCEMLVL